MGAPAQRDSTATQRALIRAFTELHLYQKQNKYIPLHAHYLLSHASLRCSPAGRAHSFILIKHHILPGWTHNFLNLKLLLLPVYGWEVGVVLYVCVQSICDV